VDAAAGFIVAARVAGFSPLAAAVAAGLAGGGAVAPELWPNAEGVASIVAMATIVILRMDVS
jgi:hypothetical protein